MADFNYIRFPQDIAPTSNIERSDKIIIAKTNGDTFVTTIVRLSKIVGESGQRVEPVAPGELPYLDTLSERFMEVDLEGDYYFEGILLANNPNGYKTLFWWDGDKWEYNSQYRVLGEKGDSVEDVTVNEDGDLIITYTDGVIANAGHVKGEKGDPLPYSEWSAEDVDKLIEDVNINAQRIPAITAGVLPTPPQANMYMVVTGVGAYTYGGTTIGTNADGYQTTFWWNGTAWSNNGSVKVKGDMPTGTDTLESELVPKGKAVEDYVDLALSDKIPYSGAIFKRYVNASGTYSGSVNYDSTQPIPVKLGDMIEVSGETAATFPILFGMNNSDISLATVKQNLLIGSTSYNSVRFKITNPDIKFVVASAKNATFTPPPTTPFKVDVYKSKVDVLKEYVDESIEDIDIFSKSKLVDIEGVLILGKVRRSDTGTVTTVSLRPNQAMTDFIPVEPSDIVLLSALQGSSIGMAGFDENKNYISRISDNNALSLYRVEQPNDFAITIPAGVHFITASTMDNVTNPLKVKIYKTLDELLNDENESGSSSNSVKFSKTSPTSFNIEVYEGVTKKTTIHSFVRETKTHTLGGNSIVTTDGWYSSFISEKETSFQLCQGNFNFIYKISNTAFPNENGHVGMGHGCYVSKFTQFFIDGKAIDIDTTAEMVGDVFSFQVFADCYAVDDTISVSNSDNLPKLDGSGNPIVACTHQMWGWIYSDGRTHHRNRLTIKRDGTIFDQCHAAMNACYRPYFDMVSFVYSDFVLNRQVVEEGEVVVTPLNGSIINTKAKTRYYTNEVQQWSSVYPYKLWNRITNMDNTQQHKANVNFYYAVSPNWLKVYMQPIICVSNPNGSAPDVFNNGSVIDVLVEREIKI